MACISMAGATVLRGVSRTARDAVAVGCCRWEQWHDVADTEHGKNRRVRRWHACFPNARSLVFWCDAWTPLQFPCLTSLCVPRLAADVALALASAIDLGTLPRLEHIGVWEIECDVAAFDLGRSLAASSVLHSVTVNGGLSEDSNNGAFLEGLSTTTSVTQLLLSETSISHLVDFSPRLPHLLTLALSCCGGDMHADELGGGAALGDEDAFLYALDVLAPCASLTHLRIEPDAVCVPLTSALLALPYLTSLSHVVSTDGRSRNTHRPSNQIVTDTHNLLQRTPRLEQLVVQRNRVYIPGAVAGQRGTFEPTLCDVAVRKPVNSASVAQLREPREWAYAILPLAAARPSRDLGDDLRGVCWGDKDIRLFERLASMARMQGPPPHEVSWDGGGSGESP